MRGARVDSLVVPEELNGVGWTSIGVALIRAVESERPDRLFDDPYARRLVAAAPSTVEGWDGSMARLAAMERVVREGAGVSPTEPGAAFLVGLAGSVAVRTRFYDRYLLDACAQGCRQVVLVAAGLDARAYRLDFPPGVRLFELDQPSVLAFKDRVLAGVTPHSGRTSVPVDLRTDWAIPLAAAGFDPTVPTAWLIEGLLIYLTPDGAGRLLTTVLDRSAPGSQVAFEQSRATRERGALDALRDRSRAGSVVRLWKGGLGTDGVAWLRERGWTARSVSRAAVAKEYGRPSPELSGEFVTGVLGGEPAGP